MADTKYCYPGTDVLKNKLDICDGAELEVAEREITGARLSAMRSEPLPGNFDFAHLKSMHKALFGDLYAWAGNLRTVDIGKGVQFATAMYLDENANKIFKDLKRDRFLVGMPYAKAIEKLAYYLGEINVLHPFREGNGRTQRIFTEYLAKATGLSLDFSKCDAGRMLLASRYSAIAADNTKFEVILRDISEPMTLAEQKEFLRSVSPAIYATVDWGTVADRTVELSPEPVAGQKTMEDWMARIAERKARDGEKAVEPQAQTKTKDQWER